MIKKKRKRKMRWFDEWIDDVAKLFRTFDVIKFAFASKWGLPVVGWVSGVALVPDRLEYAVVSRA